ncbi:hypothetical protein CKAH01_13234 [Colletotrichum kahawae]|uniref:Secreted protein n=1 Tax=Colletotrichum kahawae TaxID=34407 RepID=A0AAE0DA27_COLKA|nr:hypothetical protein CKAH01_13234 [Colletotrichum kahawae]
MRYGVFWLLVFSLPLRLLILMTRQQRQAVVHLFPNGKVDGRSVVARVLLRQLNCRTLQLLVAPPRLPTRLDSQTVAQDEACAGLQL